MRGRHWRLAVARGLGWLIVAVVGGVGVLGVVDYWIRFQDPGMRVICTLSLVLLVGWVFYRFFCRQIFNKQWRKRLSDLSLAQDVERTFPQLGDSLASSIEFMHQPADDPRAGSAALRRAVVADTTAKTELMDFNRTAETVSMRRAVMSATAICLLAATVAVLDPLWVQIAVARLAYPLGNVGWPQKTHLELVERVERVAAGGPFEVEVIDSLGAKLPNDAEIFYRFEEPDGSVKEENQPLRHLGKTLQARRENVTRPFSYRIVGGDDRSMEWVAVEIVEPPSVESLSVRLTPPKYSGWPIATLDESRAAEVRVLAGTKLRIEGAVNKPIESVKLRLGKERTVDGVVNKDGMRFVVPGENVDKEGFAVEQSNMCHFEIIDRQGLVGNGGPQWDIRVIEDRPPSVTIERPLGTVYATPQATVPLGVLVKDDLAVRRVNLVARVEDILGQTGKQAETMNIVLFEGPANPRQDDNIEAGESRTVDYRWELEGFDIDGQALQPGTKVVFHVEAEDYKPLLGKSDSRRLVIITPREMLDRIAARQESIIDELAAVLKMQRQSLGRVEGLLIRLEEAGRLRTSDLDQLKKAELEQRDVAETLTSRKDGVYARIGRMLRDLENNRLENPETQRRMERVLGEIEQLQNRNLNVIAAEMTAAVKSARNYQSDRLEDSADDADKPDAYTLDSLQVVAKNQTEVAKSLEAILQRLAGWGNYRRFHREFGQLISKQEDLLRQTVELSRKTLTKSLNDLAPQEAAELRIAARDEAELARRLDRTVEAMLKTAAKLARVEPAAARTLNDAAGAVDRYGIAAQMRSVDDNLRKNRIAQATASERQVIEDMQKVLDILANRRRRATPDSAKRLREIKSKLAALTERQNKLNEETKRLDGLQRKKTPEVVQPAGLDRVARQQAALVQDTGGLAEKMTGYGVFRLALSTAAAKMEIAANRLSRGKTDTETQAPQQEAVKRLSQMLGALKSVEKEQKASNGAGTGGKGGGKDNSKTIQMLARLRLIKMLQSDINRQTETLEQKFGDKTAMPDAARRRYAELADEQRRLADLILLLPSEGQ